MVERTDQRAKSGVVVDTPISKVDPAGLLCVGDVCYDPATNRIDLHLRPDASCPPEALKRVVEGTLAGAKVQIHVPAKE